MPSLCFLDGTREPRERAILQISREQEIQRRNIARLASLLANGVEVLAWHTYPNGWDFSSGERLYEFATESMLRAADRLNHPSGRAEAMHG